MVENAGDLVEQHTNVLAARRHFETEIKAAQKANKGSPLPADQLKQLRAAYKASYAFRERIDTDGFDHPQKVYDLTAALLTRGYSDANVELVLGGNFRRLLGSTWAQPNTPEDKKS